MLSNCLLKRHHGNWVEQSVEVKLCEGSVQQRLGRSDAYPPNVRKHSIKFQFVRA